MPTQTSSITGVVQAMFPLPLQFDQAFMPPQPQHNTDSAAETRGHLYDDPTGGGPLSDPRSPGSTKFYGLPPGLIADFAMG